MQSCPSTPDGDRGSSPQWERESCISRNLSNLTELIDQQPSSPGSESTSNGGSLHASGSSSSLADLVRKRLDESEAESLSNQRSPPTSEAQETGEPSCEKNLPIAFCIRPCVQIFWPS